jgi:uncharacterized protein with GYD domain
MPKYLLEVHYTKQGDQALLDKGGTARQRVASAAAKSLGGKLESFYFAFGDVDAFAVFEMPDPESAAALALTVAASGAVNVKTVVLLTPAQIDAAAEHHVKYRPPGS